MKRLIFTLLFVFSVTIPLPVAVAQSDNPTCNPSALLAELAKMKSTGDDAKDIAALVELQDQITEQNIVCNGYVFEGKGTGVVKPFDLPKGTYLLHFSAASGGISITPKVISGKCAEGMYLFTMSMQEAIELESYIDSAGCKLGLSVDYTPIGKTAWTLTIEPLG